MTDQPPNDQFKASSFLQGHNAEYVEQLYARYAGDPERGRRGLGSSIFRQPRRCRRGLKRAVLDSIRALMLIRAYRIRGHLVADLDPLGMRDQTPHPELDPKSYGFTEADMDRPIFSTTCWGFRSPRSARSSTS
jgi:2-oxoglutarate dehydrogenase E1 component